MRLAFASLFAGQGVVGQAGARGGVDAEHGPAEERRVPPRVAQAEGTQGTPLGGRRRLRLHRRGAGGSPHGFFGARGSPFCPYWP